MNILSIQNISKHINGKKILRHINLELSAGEIVGLVGPNGAGKTSLMKLIAGYTIPTDGIIEISGHNVITEHKAAMAESAFLVGEPGLYPNLSGKRHLQMFCDAREIAQDAIASVSDFLNFGEQLDHKVKTYSIGMKQRLALALCWIDHPKLLVLDEPVNGLDPEGIFLLRKRIIEIASSGTAVLVSSHLLDELQKISSRIIFINHGEIIGESKGNELEEQYRKYFPTAESEALT